MELSDHPAIKTFLLVKTQTVKYFCFDVWIRWERIKDGNEFTPNKEG